MGHCRPVLERLACCRYTGVPRPMAQDHDPLRLLVLTDQLPLQIGAKKLRAYVRNGETEAALLGEPRLLESIERFEFGLDESLHLARNGLTVYVKPTSVERLQDVLSCVARLVDISPGPRTRRP